MTTYAIHATISTHELDRNGQCMWHGSRSVPTFYLESDCQGIVSKDHAARLAAEIINPVGSIAPGDLHVSAYAVNHERELRELAGH